MKPQDIKVGSTYKNKGAGKTLRKVIAIGDEHKPDVYWNYDRSHPHDVGVLYEQKGKQYRLYLKSFSKWCGSEVTE